MGNGHDNIESIIKGLVGLDFASTKQYHKQERYLDLDGKGDYIDECARTLTPEEFRGAMKFTIGKYMKRLGKKDEILKEVTKIADYSNRWLEYEKKIHEES